MIIHYLSLFLQIKNLGAPWALAQGVSSCCSQRGEAISSEVLSLMGRSNSRVAYSWLVWSGASVPLGPHVGLSSGLLELPSTWNLASPQTSDPRVKVGSNGGSYDLAVEVTHRHGRHLPLVTWTSSDSVWEETTKARMAEAKDDWGPSWRLATIWCYLLHIDDITPSSP